jgi:hypothetical protein
LCENQGYYWINNSNYPALYSFTDDSLGSTPEGFNPSVDEGIKSEIIASLDGHFNVLNLSDYSESKGFHVNTTFSPVTQGIVEFWIRAENNFYFNTFHLGSNGTQVLWASLYNYSFTYYDTSY